MSRVITYDPFRNFRTIQGEINRLFERDLHNCSSDQMAELPVNVDIREDENQIVIKADVPGMEQKDININVDNNLLTISGERKFADKEHQDKYHRVERAYGRFSRTFQLNNSTEVKNITATYNSGVLEVALPKLEEAKPRSIQVQVN
ncbi:MAG: Hsp20/alpha crystallin family protein [Magnetococcales bacterium]|nr:Hsp20/alpha crystallin family protein [Magnetococcales bacterium]